MDGIHPFRRLHCPASDDLGSGIWCVNTAGQLLHRRRTRRIQVRHHNLHRRRAAAVVAEDELSLVECEEEAEIDAKALLRKKGVQGGMIKVCSFRKGEQIFVGVRTIPSVKMPKNLNHSQQTKDPQK